MSKIIILSPGLSLPRYVKRISSFVKGGHEVILFGFERGTFQNIEAYPSSVNVVNFGQLDDGKGYIANIKFHYKHMRPIIDKYNKEDVYFYALGFVPALLLCLFSKKPYFYEISDLVYGTFRNALFAFPLKMVDRYLIKKSYFTIMTSRGFMEYLFPGTIKNNIMIQPNKLDNSFLSMERSKKEISKNINFGFIGYIRYPNTIFRFASIIGKRFPNFNFHFYGDSIYRDQALLISERYSNVLYHGKYKNPDDIKNIYDSIDVIVSCYDTATLNELVAEPNKLYESLFFCKPIIVSPNTFLARRVKELNCGYEIDATNDDSIIDFLLNLNISDLNRIADNEFNLSLNEIVDNPTEIVKLFN